MSEYLCPHCNQPTYDDDALLCHFCGDSLGRASSGALGQIKSSGQKKWVFIAVALIALAAFVILVVR